jgi:hypothetical protein
VASASSRLTCTPNRLGLYSKLPKGGTLCLKVSPPLCDNFIEVSRTKANTIIYNQGLNLKLNRMFKGYVRDMMRDRSAALASLVAAKSVARVALERATSSCAAIFAMKAAAGSATHWFFIHYTSWHSTALLVASSSFSAVLRFLVSFSQFSATPFALQCLPLNTSFFVQQNYIGLM